MSKCKEDILFTQIFGQKPTQSELKTNIQDVPGMIIRLSFILVFVSGVAVAFLCSYLPNISTLLGLTSSFDRNVKSGFSYKLSADEKYGILGKGDIPNFHTSTLTVKKPQDLEIHPDKTVEAIASVTLARDMVEAGKVDKAMKLYQHAYSLDPTHPDVLVAYGEFLEKFKKDVVKAEHLYCRALTYSPEHSKALENRERTMPVVEEIDQNLFNRIDRKRDFLVQVPDSNPGLKRMKQESYYRHVHHTTAIEGNTFTLAQTRAVVENRMAIAGKSIMEHNEIIGLDAALSYVNNTLVQRIGAITVDDILEIHKRVLGYVDPVEAGRFRTTQVYVGEFVPPEASEIDRLMNEFIEWLNSDLAFELHPIELAALAHYKLVTIHPFFDGNGRTSRLLMNLILMQVGFPPVIIPKEQKHRYYHALEMANKGDVRPFIRFIARCTERTVDEFLISSSEKFNFAIPDLTHRFDDDIEYDGRTIILEEMENDTTGL